MVNYITPFVEILSSIIRPLQMLLKKNPPPWTYVDTTAIQALKRKASQLPPLQIPSTGKQILQTDASESFWAAVLLEEINGKRHVCGYKSGPFKESEKHYHSTYKEVLAIKRGIEKFQFHLIGHHFLVEMDCTAFPGILKFRAKQIPAKQLLRWAEWFSAYNFEVKHIKGKNNILPDILSRPTHIPKTIPVISMMNITSTS